MAIGDNSYGSVDEVIAITRRYTADGEYTATTRPSLTEVEKCIDRVSAVVNVLLAEAGFDIPVSQADAKLALDEFVVEQAAQLCHAANGVGAYAPGSETLRNTTVNRVILRDAETFIGDHAVGLELLGATRTYSLTDGLACRTEDDGGNEIVPMFQREMMDNEIVDWDE